ncbi:hypothetical protein [Sinorhizobium meliloti]|nr:hypothetical protein [Sinorhizobium meliloti]
MSAADFAQLFGVYTQGGMSWETFYERGQNPEGAEDERQAALV